MTTFENDDEIITKAVDGSAKLTRKFSPAGMVKVKYVYLQFVSLECFVSNADCKNCKR